MLHKKGFELSINFIVVLILSLVIFGFGLRFAYDLAKKATEIQRLSSEELDANIGELLCEGSDRVCVGIDRLELRQGKSGVFGVKIWNYGDETEFKVSVTQKPSDCGIAKDGVSYITTNCNRVYLINNGLTSSSFIPPSEPPATRTLNIALRESATIGIGAVVEKDAQQGTYIFNLEVKRFDTAKRIWDVYSPVQKMYVDVS